MPCITFAKKPFKYFCEVHGMQKNVVFWPQLNAIAKQCTCIAMATQSILCFFIKNPFKLYISTGVNVINITRLLRKSMLISMNLHNWIYVVNCFAYYMFIFEVFNVQSSLWSLIFKALCEAVQVFSHLNFQLRFFLKKIIFGNFFSFSNFLKEKFQNALCYCLIEMINLTIN